MGLIKSPVNMSPTPESDLNLSDITYWIENRDYLHLVEGFISIRQIYNAAIKETITKLEILNSEFQSRFDHNPIHHVSCRLKTARSMVRKLQQRGKEINIASAINNLLDIAGVRVVCSYLDDVYRVEELLLRQSDVNLIHRKDYVKSPKANGYRSLHLVVSVLVFLADSAERVPVEIQIRTEAMDFWASLEHQLWYKRTDKLSAEVNQELMNCSLAVRDLDERMQRLHDMIRNGTPSGDASAPDAVTDISCPSIVDAPHLDL